MSPRVVRTRVAIITRNPGGLTLTDTGRPEDAYRRLELGRPIPEAPPCVICGRPASLELVAGPVCRRCVNSAVSAAYSPPKSPPAPIPGQTTVEELIALREAENA